MATYIRRTIDLDPADYRKAALIARMRGLSTIGWFRQLVTDAIEQVAAADTALGSVLDRSG